MVACASQVLLTNREVFRWCARPHLGLSRDHDLIVRIGIWILLSISTARMGLRPASESMKYRV